MEERKFTLRQWRVLNNMSRRELAEKIGRDPSTIVRWETDASAQPRIDDVAKIEQALGIDWAKDVRLP